MSGSFSANAVTASVINTDPDAVDDSYTTRANETLTIAAPGFLANDTDADGDTVLGDLLIDDVDHGTLNNASVDGSFVYIPDPGFVGTDSFSYSVTDFHGGTDIATVTIEVINSAPVANADLLADPLRRNGGPQVIAHSLILANDTDADGDALTIATVTAGAGGTVSLNAAGDVVFTPTSGFQGQAFFTYTASDGVGTSEAARVDLLIGITGTSGDDVFTGTAAADYLFGLEGNDLIRSRGAGDVFVATVNDGNDVYLGSGGKETYDLSQTSANATVDLQNGVATSAQTGSDLLTSIANVIGSSGNDTIRGSNANNHLDGRGGNDLIEALDGQDTLLGGDGSDTLLGGAGADWLDGEGGADTLTGGVGGDVFSFSTELGPSNIDAITDFDAADVIQLDTDVFSAVAEGKLDADAFHVGPVASDTEDRIVYDSVTGALYYDADGNGSGAAIQFATLTAGLSLTSHDFVGYGGQ